LGTGIESQARFAVYWEESNWVTLYSIDGDAHIMKSWTWRENGEDTPMVFHLYPQEDLKLWTRARQLRE
jgi:hypothetical protein